jgi:NADH-quinone oxidoreductase subunit J
MAVEQITFWLFSAVMIAAALRVITARNPVHSVLFLVLSFFTAAGLWLMLEAEFLGIVLVLVYVGAVMVLFLFVVMMIDVNMAPLREGFVRFLPVGALVGLVMVAELVLIVGPRYFGADRYQAPPPAP